MNFVQFDLNGYAPVDRDEIKRKCKVMIFTNFDSDYVTINPFLL